MISNRDSQGNVFVLHESIEEQLLKGEVQVLPTKLLDLIADTFLETAQLLLRLEHHRLSEIDREQSDLILERIRVISEQMLALPSSPNEKE